MSSKYLILSVISVAIALFFVSYTASPTKADLDLTHFDENIYNLPKNYKNNKPKEFIVTVTGYSSSYDETDDTPYITASGDFVRDGIVATNFLPFGSKIKIPALFGDKVFVVKDRMNERYFYRVDVWFPSKEDALNFGIHYNVKIEVLD